MFVQISSRQIFLTIAQKEEEKQIVIGVCNPGKLKKLPKQRQKSL
jgi:hypothetical protein